MTIVKAPTPAVLAEAAALLKGERLVAFPTETVYGLGCLATSDAAVANAYAAKGRPAHNPLIIHLPDIARAAKLALLSDRALALAEAFWPGPLTMVLPQRPASGLSARATAGLSTVAIRVPGHPVAQALLREVDAPIAGPSANPSGRISPTAAEHVAQDLAGRVDMVIDGGACPVGIESTVVDMTDAARPVILREGAIARDRLVALLGPVGIGGGDQARPASPGQLASHYAPRLAVRLDATSVEPDEALLAFGPDAPKGAGVTLNLSPSGDLEEAARHLYAMLRRLDDSGAARIAVMPLPPEGLGAALNDRLRRAAAPRS